MRSGVDANGNKWEIAMQNTYGYVRGTEGVDGDHIDVFLSDDIDGWNGRKVYVVDQYNEDGSFDEHKVMLGCNETDDAEAAYFANYDKDWAKKQKTVVTAVSLEDFEKWIDSSHRKTKAFAEYKSVKAVEGQNGGQASEEKNDVREQMADGKQQSVSAADAALRDALTDKLRESGIEVVTDSEAAQRVLDEANGKARTMSFGEEYDYEQYSNGRVEPGLADKVVHVERAELDHGFANFDEAREWAKENIVRTLNNEESGGKGNVKISGTAVNKYLSESAVAKSDSKDVHLAVLKKLPDVIRESIDVETTPDFKKDENGERKSENPINEDVLIHRCYGAVEIDGNIYRVKITLKEYKDAVRDNKVYSYEATKIELLAGTLVGGDKSSNPGTNNSLSVAKLLKDVEMSYNPGVKVLEESKKRSEKLREHRVFHGSGADHVRFFRTPNGEAYGFTVDGKIYLDPKIATAETPIHEYAHLWADAFRKVNPQEWSNIVNLMKGTPMWEEVKRMYPELKTDDAIADEVLADLLNGVNPLAADGMQNDKKELIAVHNISEDNLKQALDLGGFPMPSIAITKAGVGHTSFGDISLVFDKESINPTDKRNKVYGEDAWTPVFPQVGYKLNTDKTNNIYNKANKAKQLPMFNPVDFHPSNYENRIDNRGDASLVEHFKEDYGAKQLYLSEIRNAAKERIRAVSEEDYQTQRSAITDRLSEIEIPGAGNGFSATMEMIQNIQDAVAKSHTAKGIHKYLKTFYPEITMETANEIADIVKDIQHMSARYFEAKPYRAIGFDEVKLAVVPSDMEPSMVERLKQMGIEVRTYDKGNQAQRKQIVDKATEDLRLRFQLIGEKGAENLDKAEEATTRLGNLSVAREMEQANKDAKAIKLATGWERGADGKWRYEVQDFNVDVYNALVREYQSLGVEFGDGIAPSREAFDKGFNLWVRGYDNEGYEDAYNEYQRLIDKFGLGKGNNRYNQLAGEVEARNVQSRIDMTEEERRNSLALETEDVAREDQIFIMENVGKAEMGSRVDRYMTEMGMYFEGANLNKNEQAAVDVFSGKADNKVVSVERENGNNKVVMRQGNENHKEW